MMPPLSSFLRALAVSLSLAAASLSFAEDTVPNPADNLVSNGNFEEGTTGWPSGGEGIDYVKDGENTFLQLKSTEPGKQIQAHRKVDTQGQTGKFQLTYRARWTEIVPGTESWHVGSLVLHFKDESGLLLKPDPQQKKFKGSSDAWENFTVEMEIPSGATALEIMPALFQVESGTLEIDDIVLVPVK